LASLFDPIPGLDGSTLQSLKILAAS
jgi:hypothetical protein